MNQQTFNPPIKRVETRLTSPETRNQEARAPPSRICIQQISDATLTQLLVQFLEKKQSAGKRRSVKGEAIIWTIPH